MRHIKLFEGFDEKPKYFSTSEYEKVKAAAIQYTEGHRKALEEIKGELEEKYPEMQWIINEYVTNYSTLSFVHELTFKKEKYSAQRLVTLSVDYKTDRISNYSNDLKANGDAMFSASAYFYREVTAYGEKTKDQNPTKTEKKDKPFTAADVRDMLKDMDEELTYLRESESVQEAFTFKTEKPTGRFKSFDSDTHHIKIKGFGCGFIDDKKPHKVRMMIWKTAEDKAKPGNNPNCDWKWITFQKESGSIQEAKDWLNKNFDSIMKRWDVRQTEDK